MKAVAKPRRQAMSQTDFSIELPPDSDPRMVAAHQHAQEALKAGALAANAVSVVGVGGGGSEIFMKTIALLGGSRYWPKSVRSDSDVHTAIKSGVPYGSLLFLLSSTKDVAEADIAEALDVSTRTLRRGAEAPDKDMPRETASRAWKLAKMLAQASDVFGSREAAERWMSARAIGLNGDRPIDLLQTGPGADVVSEYLERLELGVYS